MPVAHGHRRLLDAGKVARIITRGRCRSLAAIPVARRGIEQHLFEAVDAQPEARMRAEQLSVMQLAELRDRILKFR